MDLHVFLPKRYGHGVCAECGKLKNEGPHREMTAEEVAEAQRLLDSLIDMFN